MTRPMQEIFETHGKDWWDENGPFKPLHALNPIRLDFIISHLRSHFQDLSTLEFLDVGCGGGLVTEPLAHFSPHVTGLDESHEAIKAANAHASLMGLSINYKEGSTCDLIKEKKKFDVVLALEIVEHVKNPDAFIQDLESLIKPGGLLFISTLNRTLKSYALGIIAAEYFLKWAPVGTHEWGLFLKPHELSEKIMDQGLQICDIKGLCYDPLRKKWRLDRDLDINYILLAKKA